MSGSSTRSYTSSSPDSDGQMAREPSFSPERPVAAASYRRCATPVWLRTTALAMSGMFLWMTALAVPAQALAHSAALQREGVRVLQNAEMKRLVGKQGAPHQLSFSQTYLYRIERRRGNLWSRLGQPSC
jgi:hypothetical protein